MYGLSIINLVSPATGQQLEKYQLDFDVSGLPPGVNPFNDEEIAVSAVFTGADGTPISINAFWMADFCRDYLLLPDPTLTSYDDPSHNLCVWKNLPSEVIVGPPVEIVPIPDPGYLKPLETITPWHVRFAPPLTGRWDYYFIIATPSDSVTFPGGSFSVVGSTNMGYITAVGRNFGYTNSADLFFPVGINAVGTLATYAYNRSVYNLATNGIDQVANNKGNYVRLFLAHPFFGIEWKEDGLNIYYSRQNRAFDLDDVIEYARRRNVYLQLCIEAAQFFEDDTTVNPETFWSDNPYSAITPDYKNLSDNFFTNGTSIKIYKKKLRYIIARWGYSTHIFAFEFFNELDLLYGPEEFVTYTSPWFNLMIDYCKSTLGDQHIYTTSFANALAGNPMFMEKTDLDFYTDHQYERSRNYAHHINWFANKAKIQYGHKPYILGELGDDHIWSAWGDSTFLLYNCYQLHDALWASVLSGCSASAIYWSHDVYNTCWGGQLAYFIPLVNFLAGENLNLADFTAISNQCIDYDYGFGVTDICVPSYDDGKITFFFTPAELGQTISTNDDYNLEVFALQYLVGNRILGWVRNKNNYYHNLPLQNVGASGIDVTSAPGIYGPARVDPIYGALVTINVPCDGIYHIDFYNTYPQYNINGRGPEDGGMIDAFSISVTSDCGKLTFAVPPLIVLDPATRGTSGPYAPDYAFKITAEIGWGHYVIGDTPDFSTQSFAVMDDYQIAYRGSDGGLNCFYVAGHDVYGDIIWANAVLASGGASNVKLTGAIARGRFSGQIYYHGQDDKLQVVWWGGSGWLHDYIDTDWGSAAKDVGGDIVCNGVGGEIFYRGNDAKMHHYYWGGSGWVHEILYIGSSDFIAVGSNLAVSADGTLVAYKATNGKLQMFYKGGGAWFAYGAPVDVGGTIRMNDAGDVIFYTGTDGNLYEYYYLGGAWNNRPITLYDGSLIAVDGPFDITPVCTWDDAQIYIRGDYDRIQAIYVAGGSWVKNFLLQCYDNYNSGEDCLTNGGIRFMNGIIVYESVFGRFEAYQYGFCGNLW